MELKGFPNNYLFIIKPERHLDKGAYSKINFPISQPNQILRVLKRIILMRCSFEHPKPMIKLTDKNNGEGGTGQPPNPSGKSQFYTQIFCLSEPMKFCLFVLMSYIPVNIFFINVRIYILSFWVELVLSSKKRTYEIIYPKTTL